MKKEAPQNGRNNLKAASNMAKKGIFLLLITITVFNSLHAQAEFTVEGKEVKIGSIIKNYKFHYKLEDSIRITFSDSIITYFNADQSIKKQISYSNYSKTIYTNLNYFSFDKKDSISKQFAGNELGTVYEWHYDSLRRITLYRMKDFLAESNSDRSFEWIYLYRDSLTSEGKLSVQTVLIKDIGGDARFHFRVIREYDKENKIIRQTSENKENDPWAQTIVYIYKNDSLVEERISTAGSEAVFLHGKEENDSPCHKEFPIKFAASDFNYLRQLVQKLVEENSEILNSSICENLKYKYVSEDRKIILILNKIQPYWEGGMNVFITVTEEK